MAGKKTHTEAKAAVHVVRETAFDEDPSVLWRALESHARVQVRDAKNNVVMDATAYGGKNGLAWAG